MEKANRSPKKNNNWKTNVPGIPINPIDLTSKLHQEWVEYISEFERQLQQNKTVKVYQRLGRPPFVLAKYLDSPKLSQELNRLIQLMEERGLYISTLSPIDDHTLYQFITEELFDYDMEDVRIAGMKTQFCYESFHPNHEYDLIHYTEDGIQHLLSTEEEYWMLAFHDQAFITQQGNPLETGIFIKKATVFKQCFEWFEIHELNDFSIEYDLETKKASSTFHLNYSACPRGSHVPLQYQGKGHLGFIYCCEDWFINQLELPGFSV